jgi:hypothetical protein
MLGPAWGPFDGAGGTDGGVGSTGLTAAGAIPPRPGLHLCGFRISTRGMLNEIPTTPTRSPE